MAHLITLICIGELFTCALHLLSSASRWEGMKEMISSVLARLARIRDFVFEAMLQSSPTRSSAMSIPAGDVFARIPFHCIRWTWFTSKHDWICLSKSSNRFRTSLRVTVGEQGLMCACVAGVPWVLGRRNGWNRAEQRLGKSKCGGVWHTWSFEILHPWILYLRSLITHISWCRRPVVRVLVFDGSEDEKVAAMGQGDGYCWDYRVALKLGRHPIIQDASNWASILPSVVRKILIGWCWNYSVLGYFGT